MLPEIFYADRILTKLWQLKLAGLVIMPHRVHAVSVVNVAFS